MRALTLLPSLLLTLSTSGQALAWGAEGHEYTGAIADQLLNSHAQREVQSILGFTLQIAATWPDCVRSVRRMGPDRFVFTEDPKHPEYTASCTTFETPEERARMEDYAKRNWDNCSYYPGHGCHESYHFADVAEQHGQYDRRYVGTSDHDVVSAINAAVTVLQGNTAPTPFSIKDAKEALLLLAHFVGDLHQPLHVGAVYLTQDGSEIDPDVAGAPDAAMTATHGGNSIIDGRTNLHSEWDAIPENLGLPPTESALEAARQVPMTQSTPGNIAKIWASDTVVEAHDAFVGVSFKGVGDHPPYHWVVDFDNRPDYFKRKQALQERQLIKSGAHLAELLNAIWR